MTCQGLTLADTCRPMERAAIRQLSVVRNGAAVGVVSHRDLLAAWFSLLADFSPQEERRVLSRIPVGEVLHQALVVSPETPVPEADRIMLERTLGCLPVTNGEGLGSASSPRRISGA